MPTLRKIKVVRVVPINSFILEINITKKQLKGEQVAKASFKYALDRISTEETQENLRKLTSDEILTSRSQNDIVHQQNLYINKLLLQNQSLQNQNKDLKAKVQRFYNCDQHQLLNEIDYFKNQMNNFKNTSLAEIQAKNQEISRIQHELDTLKLENQKLMNIQSLVEEIEEKCNQLASENQQLQNTVTNYRETQEIVLSQQNRLHVRFLKFYKQLNQLKNLVKTTFVCEPPKLWKQKDQIRTQSELTMAFSNLFEISINTSIIYDWMYPFLEKILQNLNFKL